MGKVVKKKGNETELRSLGLLLLSLSLGISVLDGDLVTLSDCQELRLSLLHACLLRASFLSLLLQHACWLRAFYVAC